MGGVPYFFDASKRDKADFRINNIAAFINSVDSPSHMDERIFTAQLCRTEKPDEERLMALQQKAETILQALNLGQWQIDGCYVDEKVFGEAVEYTVNIKAVPVWEGMPVCRQPQLAALGDGERDYLTDVNFVFSANGDLISFWLYSPMDTEAVIDERVLNVDQLLEVAEETLASRDAAFYDEKGMSRFAKEALGCTVTVTEIRWELNRVKLPDSQEVCYIPSAQFWGNVMIYGIESGKIYDASEAPRRLLTINTQKEE